MVKRVKTIPKLMYEIRPSRVLPCEVSVYAVRNISQGEIIAAADSPEEVVFIHLRNFKKLDKLTQAKIKNFCVLDEDNEYCVPADLNNMGTSWYFNHSCAPNVAYDKQENFIAERNIKKDEELFLDYGRMFTDPKFRMKCSCGSAHCRKVITGSDWLDQKFREDNLNKMWPEMRKLPVKK